MVMQLDGYDGYDGYDDCDPRQTRNPDARRDVQFATKYDFGDLVEAREHFARYYEVSEDTRFKRPRGRPPKPEVELVSAATPREARTAAERKLENRLKEMRTKGLTKSRYPRKRGGLVESVLAASKLAARSEADDFSISRLLEKAREQVEGMEADAQEKLMNSPWAAFTHGMEFRLPMPNDP
jgi:hypothetical protein